MSDSGQVDSSAAEVYDEFFLPALFEEWPPKLIDAAKISAGMRVLDVACGTGVLATRVSEAVAPNGQAVGLDLNPGMLAVARRKSSKVDWHEGPAENLPFGNADFDAVVSQFGLMFFENREKALAEMWRVLRPGGHLAVAVWDSLDNVPGYAGVTALLARLFGNDIADLLRAPFVLGDTKSFEALLRDSGVADPQVFPAKGDARFSSIRAWMHTDIRGWTLSDKINDEQFELLVGEAERELSEFVAADGSVQFEHPALIATARKA